jgi:hypothetical protein
MDITGAFYTGHTSTGGYQEGAFYQGKSYGMRISAEGTSGSLIQFQASRAWTGTTNTAQPQTVNLGSGQALDITPSYYTCHMWLRTS